MVATQSVTDVNPVGNTGLKLGLVRFFSLLFVRGIINTTTVNYRHENDKLT